jgi:hypothetical protein
MLNNPYKKAMLNEKLSNKIAAAKYFMENFMFSVMISIMIRLLTIISTMVTKTTTSFNKYPTQKSISFENPIHLATL